MQAASDNPYGKTGAQFFSGRRRHSAPEAPRAPTASTALSISSSYQRRRRSTPGASSSMASPNLTSRQRCRYARDSIRSTSFGKPSQFGSPGLLVFLHMTRGSSLWARRRGHSLWADSRPSLRVRTELYRSRKRTLRHERAAEPWATYRQGGVPKTTKAAKKIHPTLKVDVWTEIYKDF